jgi:XTP/dITP diphosphohydrolase
MKRLVIASNNAGKLGEINAILAPLEIEALAQSELGVGEAAEPHVSFVENAIAKARHASLHTRLPALADDSGICVTVLGGAPGVHSARYAGKPRSDARNNAKLIAELQGKSDRSAYYYCVMALLRHADDPQPVIAEGIWHGTVTDTPRGDNGFGYDPYFLLPDLGQTAAELDPATKNRLSHRGKALAALVNKLGDRATWR